MWSKVPCLKKQHLTRPHHRPLDLKSNALTITPPCLHYINFVDLQKLFHGSLQICKHGKKETHGLILMPQAGAKDFWF